LRKIWLIIPGLVVAATLAFLAMPTGTAQADGGPHIKGWGATPDGCAACHRAHRGSSELLLVEDQELLCGSCHGNDAMGSALNVMAGTNEADGGAQRAGGYESARIDTDDPSLSPAVVTILTLPSPGEAAQSKHSVDHSAQTAWAYGPIDPVANSGLAGFPLACGKCHDPHGNGNYRILRSVPTGSGGAGYTIPDTYPKAASDYATSNYFNMYFGGVAPAWPAPTVGATPPPGVSILADTSKWCSQCHTRYLARSGRTVPPPADASRADSGDLIYTYRHTSAGWGISSTTLLPSFNNRACITCHTSHGSNASMPGAYSSSVEWPDGSTVNPATDPQRASMLKMDNRGMCRKCHSIYRVP
jgi:predicted CXXCH cytochrome family protein